MNRYPTDEELSKWIESLEEQELYAPKNLKAQIMNRVMEEQTDRENTPFPNKADKRPVQLFPYALKIVAGMAAALVMLVLFPMQNAQARGVDRIALRQEQQAQNYAKWEDNYRERLEREVAWEEGKAALDQKINEAISGLKFNIGTGNGGELR